MICEECGKNPATVHFTTIINGKRYEKKLCEECMRKRKAHVSDGLTIGELLSGFLQDMPAPVTQTGRCPKCGMAYEQFRKGGLLGCAQCYQAFKPYLEPMLSRIHGRAQHAGKVPAHQEGGLALERKMERLKQEMEKAVAAEDFERAAALRDEIRALQEPKAEGEAKEHA